MKIWDVFEIDGFDILKKYTIWLKFSPSHNNVTYFVIDCIYCIYCILHLTESVV